MNTIWKYPLYVQDVQTVEMPDEADILTVQVQGDVPCLWAMVNPDGTFQLKNGSLVLHVFEITTDSSP